MIRCVSGLTILALAVALNFVQPRSVLAWGDEGHEVVALVAQSFLDPDVRKRVSALLAADTNSLTAHDIASEATWADKFRDANVNGSREKTRQWHFVDIEITAPDLDAACFNHPAITAGTPASDGPAPDCVVDKVQEFAAELANPSTDLEEQVVALNSCCTSWVTCISRCTARTIMIEAATIRRSPPPGFKAGNLHHFWDTEFVDQLGPDAKTIASDLIGHITTGPTKPMAGWRSHRLGEGDLQGRPSRRLRTTSHAKRARQLSAYGRLCLNCNQRRVAAAQQSRRSPRDDPESGPPEA